MNAEPSSMLGPDGYSQCVVVAGSKSLHSPLSSHGKFDTSIPGKHESPTGTVQFIVI